MHYAIVLFVMVLVVWLVIGFYAVAMGISALAKAFGSRPDARQAFRLALVPCSFSVLSLAVLHYGDRLWTISVGAKPSHLVIALLATPFVSPPTRGRRSNHHL